ncbi:hypothetical protein V8017_16165 [Stenotrophomonas rhizophila]
MNLEQIDTSTTAGKAEVMRLAAAGRRVAYSNSVHHEWGLSKAPLWDWRTRDYAIIAEPVGPDEVWVVYKGTTVAMGPFGDGQLAADRAEDAGPGYTVVRYVRADQ